MMSFFETEQWSEAKKRYEAFWRVEAADRCLMYLTVSENLQPDNVDINTRWRNADYRIKRYLESLTKTTYYGDAFPNFFINFGPGCLSPCVGGRFELAEGTVWFDQNPVIKEWSDMSSIAFNENSDMWQMICELTATSLQNKDKLCTSMTDLGGTLDILASLRGSESLLYDLFDYPDEVLAAVNQLELFWEETYSRLADVLFKEQGYMSTWMPIWCEERYYPLQCDFSAMISPSMFKCFVLPNLVKQTEFLEKSIYHLDGPGEIPHLSHILSMPRLTAIQWVSGDGAPNVGDPCWYEMYEQIQNAGKGLILFDVDPDKLEQLLSRISSKGLYISIHCQSHSQAKDLMQIASTLNIMR